MPYYVFRISADKKDLTLVSVYGKFGEAKDLCRKLRRKQAPGDTDVIRMAFAGSEKQAKRLLTEPRQPSSPLEEWEA